MNVGLSAARSTITSSLSRCGQREKTQEQRRRADSRTFLECSGSLAILDADSNISLSIGVQKGPPIGVQKGPPFWDVAARRDGVFRTVVDLSDVPDLQLRAPVARDPAPDRHGFAPRASRTLGLRSSRNSKSFDGCGGCGVVGEGRRGGQREALSTARRPVRAAHRPQIHSRGRASPLGLRARSRQARFLKRQESLPVSTMSQ